MKLLILSANTGQGHNSCAAAVREEALRAGSTCEIKDALAFLSVTISKLVCGSHVGMYRHFPRAYGKSYFYAERHPDLFDRDSAVSKTIALGAEKLRRAILLGGYDTVLCTHVMAATMLTRLIENDPFFSLPTAFLATDYTCSPGVDETDLSVYFIPAPALDDAFARGLLQNKPRIPAGIPVKEAFSAPADKAQAKRHFGIAVEHRHLVLMCGSMGCGPMRRLAHSLARALLPEEELTVVCGTNQRLLHDLRTCFRKEANIHVRGFEKNVPLLLDSADLYLTKPGGISTTEAAQRGVPMVLIDAVAGCESYNMEYFVGRDAAAIGKGVYETVAVAKALLRNPARLAEMTKNARGAVPAHAAKTIFDTLQHLVDAGNATEESEAFPQTPADA